MEELHKLETLVGRIQTSGKRCVLQLPGDSELVLIKCPGLGVALLRDVRGIRVTNGSPMVNIECELVGRFIDVQITGFTRVFGDLESVTVYSVAGEPIRVDISRLDQLSPAQIEDCEYCERQYGDHTVRQRLLDDRKAW